MLQPFASSLSLSLSLSRCDANIHSRRETRSKILLPQFYCFRSFRNFNIYIYLYANLNPSSFLVARENSPSFYNSNCNPLYPRLTREINRKLLEKQYGFSRFQQNDLSNYSTILLDKFELIYHSNHIKKKSGKVYIYILLGYFTPKNIFDKSL